MLSLSLGWLDATSIVNVAKVVFDILGLLSLNVLYFFLRNTGRLLLQFFYSHQQMHDSW